jgi:drug/metabolite transporter (DMT)-like permease
MNPQKLAVLLMILSTVINSTGGLLVRSIEVASDWQIIFWRGAALGLAIIGIVLLQHRGDAFNAFQRIGRLGFIGGLFYGGTITAYVLSLTHTTIANAVFTMSAVPFFTALLAWWVLGERVSARTAIATLVAFAGIALMVSDGFSAGSIFGNVMAILASVSFACFVVILRKGRANNMLPATAIGALFAAIVAAIVLQGKLFVPLRDLAICLVWGGVIACVGHYLVVKASRHLSGAELTLIILIEFILGPIWVWLFINEVPSTMTLIGGAAVLSAVGSYALGAIIKPANQSVN